MRTEEALVTQTKDGLATSSVKVVFETGVAWVSLNRPDKRNCMNPTLNSEMHEVLDFLETDDRCGVLVLTGAGESFSAGMDLKEYFRETEAKGHMAVRRAQRDSYGWWRRLRWFERPTIAMVNGWCFGGAFGPLYACDLAVCADEAQFALSELRTRVRAMADVLLAKNPATLKAAKDAVRRVATMTFDEADDYLVVRQESLNFLDKSEGRKEGIKQFIDDKSYRPGLGAYDKSKAKA